MIATTVVLHAPGVTFRVVTVDRGRVVPTFEGWRAGELAARRGCV